MNKKSVSPLAGGIAAAIALLAMPGVASADRMSTDKFEQGVTVINSPDYFGPASKAADIDNSMYDRVNLGSLSATLWAPKAGAQGPMRDDEETTRQQMLWRDIDARLGPIGGHNSP